jgi:hypothetical protein
MALIREKQQMDQVVKKTFFKVPLQNFPLLISVSIPFLPKSFSNPLRHI